MFKAKTYKSSLTPLLISPTSKQKEVLACSLNNIPNYPGFLISTVTQNLRPIKHHLLIEPCKSNLNDLPLLLLSL